MTSQRARSSPFLEHPTARMLKDHLEYKELLKFDPRNDWSEWQTLYGFAHVGNHNRHCITYGGGPEGGTMKSHGGGWFVGIGTGAQE